MHVLSKAAVWIALLCLAMRLSLAREVAKHMY